MIMEQSLSGGLGPVYRRDLPGGGYVEIDVKRERELARTRVTVERRGKAERRDGHRPVIIAEADGDERSAGFADLYRIAADNAAIARAILELEGPDE
ncbi:MAG: hypothetical protein ABI205_05815 [Gemmatimonadaceae bacterium]